MSENERPFFYWPYCEANQPRLKPAVEASQEGYTRTIFLKALVL